MHRTRLERFAPLLLGGLALALMFALLPSSLHVPSTGPATQAVVIPAPGADAGEVDKQPALGQAGGGETVGTLQTPSVAPAFIDLAGLPARRVPTQARCVGRPARQTEDPLSPPCVASWTGGNGGATAPGVDANQVLAVMYSQYAAPVDYTTAVRDTDSPFNRTAKELLKYFQRRFQTYGRTVRLIGQRAGASPAGDAAAAASNYRPFAALPVDTPREYLLTAAAHHVVTMTGTWQPPMLPAQQLEQAAPFLWSLTPTMEDTEAATSAYVCRQLKDLPASESPNPALHGSTRIFGLLYQDQAVRDALTGDLSSSCGVSAVEAPLRSSNDVAIALARMRGANITTIIDLAPDNIQAFEQQASGSGYLPEWVLDGAQSDDLQTLARQHPEPSWAGALGPTWRWRAPQRAATVWYQAYREVDPGNAPDVWQGFGIYSSLLELFTAIQVTGPNLTPDNMQRSLFGRSLSSPDAFSPGGRYGPGRHSFISDFTIEHWSPGGSPPGGPGGSGCYLLARGGARYPVTGFEQFDSARAGGPCDGDDADTADQQRDQQATP